MNGVKIVNLSKFQVSVPGAELPAYLSIAEQIPSIGRRWSEIERARERAIEECLVQLGMTPFDGEEIRRRCMISVFPHLRTEQLHVDGILRLEWGYLDPVNAPGTWTIRTVEPEVQK